MASQRRGGSGRGEFGAGLGMVDVRRGSGGGGGGEGAAVEGLEDEREIVSGAGEVWQLRRPIAGQLASETRARTSRELARDERRPQTIFASYIDD